MHTTLDSFRSDGSSHIAGMHPSLFCVTGSRDTKVIVWDPVAAAPLVTLEGHTYQVCGSHLVTHVHNHV
jgi:hypothetical protein